MQQDATIFCQVWPSCPRTTVDTRNYVLPVWTVWPWNDFWHCDTLQQIVPVVALEWPATLQHIATYCNIFKQLGPRCPRMTFDTATHCNTLQHTATHCNNCVFVQLGPCCPRVTFDIATQCNNFFFPVGSFWTTSNDLWDCNTLQHTASFLFYSVGSALPEFWTASNDLWHCKTLQHTATILLFFSWGLVAWVLGGIERL